MIDSDYRERLQERTETFSRISKLESALYDAQLKVKVLMDEREERWKKERESFQQEAQFLMLLMGVATAVVFVLILR